LQLFAERRRRDDDDQYEASCGKRGVGDRERNHDDRADEQQRIDGAEREARGEERPPVACREALDRAIDDIKSRR
jgi:hypothetical protein